MLWRHRSRGRRAIPHAAPAPLDCTTQHTPATPLLIHELRAVRTHTRNIGSWLAVRETHPEEYLRLARSVIADLACGWQVQTGGEGRIEDLLTDSRIRLQSPDHDTPAAREHLESTRIHGDNA
ncbi:hypothetical protein HUT19_41075 [Streptomyces sp. NA02950]|uniref:hypothetical protein n=1 Tax=Streptomyces sp. NA02950 TaxID=2742137 RepID=UPI0015923AD4|nr:hypothetical protein [Streptomyces sp. NA02950]QKV90391.1 hypothetical protein HUT19_00145 [Streptomyces sp. NA02950]QKV97276.1 hypothetical protein HUT19_41075 [Streptomyces sp. NA02950]